MTYNVLGGGTLNLAQSVNFRLTDRTTTSERDLKLDFLKLYSVFEKTAVTLESIIGFS